MSGVILKFMKSWFAVFYALLALVGIPAVVYSLIPLEGMRAAYLLVTAMFAFTSAWVFLETLAALMATKIMKTSNVDLTKDRALMQEWPPIVYVVPAFFDNEAAILPGTITAYKNLKYEGPLTVMIVYNTRKAMTAEEATFTSKYHNRKFGCTKVKVLANPGSRSKAENVNRALVELSAEPKFVFIMDADHHPNEDHPERAILTMEKYGYDVLQGACTIRMAGPLSWLVAVEFEDMYNVGHRGRTSLFGIGVFGGSNGCWRRDLLCKIKMDPTMLTEDIDSSIRSTLQGAKIAYSSFLVSSEQAPEKERTLRKQRLRWAQGWFEVFSKHSLALFLSPHIGLRQKLGFFILLPFRELFVYFTFHPIILLVIYQIRHGDLDVAIFFIASGAAMLSVGFFRIIAAYFLAKGHVGRWPGAFIVFLLVQVFWVAYLNFLQVIAHGQDFVGQDTWVPTSREAALYHTRIPGAAETERYDPSGVICEDTKDIVNFPSKQLKPSVNARGLVARTNSLKANGLVAHTPRAVGNTAELSMSQGLSIFIDDGDGSPRQPTLPLQKLAPAVEDASTELTTSACVR